MSIYKHVNGKNNDREFLQKKYKYITDPLKTDGRKLVESVSCLSEHGTDDWTAVKKLYHKTEGKQGEHVVISPSPDRKETPDKKYLDLAVEIAEELFGNYNCITAVHKDNNRRHIHILFNSVSFTDGRRFHSSKSDLAENKLKVNKILESYGFDTIRTSTDEMVDDTPYDLTDGFDALEITEYDTELNKSDKPQVTKNWSLDDIIPNATTDDLYDYLNGEDITHKKTTKRLNPSINFISEERKENYMPINSYPMYTQYEKQANAPVNTPVSSCLPPTANVNTADNSKVPAVTVNPQPVQTDITNCPTMTLNFAPPKITLNVTPETTAEEIKSYLNAVTPNISSTNCMKATLAMANELNNRNINMNIEANIFPEIILNAFGTSDNAPDTETNHIW